jgi:hypothetical protein
VQRGGLSGRARENKGAGCAGPWNIKLKIRLLLALVLGQEFVEGLLEDRVGLSALEALGIGQSMFYPSKLKYGE